MVKKTLVNVVCGRPLTLSLPEISQSPPQDVDSDIINSKKEKKNHTYISFRVNSVIEFQFQYKFQLPFCQNYLIRFMVKNQWKLSYYVNIKLVHVLLHYIFVKFIYSEKATKFCEISTNYLSYVLPVK